MSRRSLDRSVIITVRLISAAEQTEGSIHQKNENLYFARATSCICNYSYSPLKNLIDIVFLISGSLYSSERISASINFKKVHFEIYFKDGKIRTCGFLKVLAYKYPYTLILLTT